MNPQMSNYNLSCVCVYELFERWQVGVDRDAAEVVDEGKVFGNVRRGPGVEEAVEDPLVSTCAHSRTEGIAFLPTYFHQT